MLVFWCTGFTITCLLFKFATALKEIVKCQIRLRHAITTTCEFPVTLNNHFLSTYIK